MTLKQLMIFTGVLFVTLVARLHAAPTLNLVNDCDIDHAGAQCFQLLTTEHKDGSGANVQLPVHLLPALNTRLSDVPVVWLNGGPGLSNLEPPFPDWIFDNFDVLVVGYRGIDGVPQLDCPSLKAAIKQVQKDKSIPFLSETALSIFQENVKSCQTTLTQSGYDTSAYGTQNVIEDLEQVRQALGYDQVSLLSASYGTRIAWYYDQLHPEKLHRNLIMSGNPTGGFYFDPHIIDEQLQLLSQWCAADPECQKHTPNLYHSIETVLTNPPKSAWGVHIDPDHLRVVTFILLYSRNTWPMLADAYGKAERGNASGLAAMLKFPNPMIGDGWTWGTFFSAGSIDFDPSRDYAQELTAVRSETALGSPFSEMIFAGLSQGWETAPVKAPLNRVSQTPTVILASEVDVATPIERIESDWMPWLTDATLLSVQGAGHTPDHIAAGGSDLAVFLQDFLVNGQTSTEQTFGQPIDWKPKFSLSWLVYAVWGGIGFIGAALIYGLIVLL